MKGVFHPTKTIEIKSTSKKEEDREIAQLTRIVNKRGTLIISTIFLIYLVNLNNDWQIKITGNLLGSDFSSIKIIL